MNGHETLISCQMCGHRFTLDEVPGAAGIKPDGQFVGRCPKCKHWHGSAYRYDERPHGN